VYVCVCRGAGEIELMMVALGYERGVGRLAGQSLVSTGDFKVDSYESEGHSVVISLFPSNPSIITTSQYMFHHSPLTASTT
jgi:hypothetical protein